MPFRANRCAPELEYLLHDPAYVELNMEKDDSDGSTFDSAASQVLDMAPEQKPEDAFKPNGLDFEELFEQNMMDTLLMANALEPMNAFMPPPMWTYPMPGCNWSAQAIRRRKKDRSLITIAAKHGTKPKSFENRSQDFGYCWNAYQQSLEEPSDLETASKICTGESCRHCGTELQMHFRFCQQCGKPRESAEDEGQVASNL